MKPQDINVDDFKPNWRSPPGDTIRDVVRMLYPSASDDDITTALALALGITVPDAVNLLGGTLPIDATLAGMLGVKLGGSAQFWLNRERQYREACSENAAVHITPDYENAVSILAREVITMADTDDNDHPDNVVTRDEHALRVLFEGRLAADVADAVADLRSRKP